MKQVLVILVALLGLANAQFSGLVIDARGLALEQHMAPNIVSQDGSMVYPVGFELDYNLVNDLGTAGLYRQFDQALRDTARVGSNPLIVRAIGLTQPRALGVVVSVEDATRIRSSFTRSDALQRLKVIIVSDKMR
ncbi:MAG: hypothetical protein SFU83_19855 [Meiothermus sp.]|nr:hypothetical protein [Meiothermus sp.]